MFYSNGIKGYHGVSIATNLEVEGVEQKDFCQKKDGRHLSLTVSTKINP